MTKKQKTFFINTLTIFPEAFTNLVDISVIGNARKKKIWELQLTDIKEFANRNKNIDDKPFGGGPGMILKADVIGKSIDACYKNIKSRDSYPMIYLSPRGTPLTQSKVINFSKMKGINLLCGRYEGVDQRILDFYPIEEISVGDYILAGGEIASQVLVESIVRLLPGTLGDMKSASSETFSNDLLEYPQYTRPKKWKNLTIPDILLSGNHRNISEWRLKQSEKLTQKVRPDLWKNYKKSKTRKK